MIDWFNFAANSLWILGCAIAPGVLELCQLAGVFAPRQPARPVRPAGHAEVIYLAGVLFCSGVAAISDPVLEIGLWVVLGGVFLAQWVGLVLRGRRAASG